jgi:DNA-binding NarL/FixJ family response regulator
MPQPVAIHVFDNLMLGMGVNTNLEKLGYQVTRLDNTSVLAHTTAEVKPFLVVVDLTTKMGDANAAIRAIKTDASLKHIRIIAYGDHQNEALLEAARQAGADVVTSNSAVASHLNEVVQQALA